MLIAPSPSSPVSKRSSLSSMMLSSTALLLTTIGTLIVTLALLILFDHNLNATKGYKLRSLEFVRNQLLIQQETLNTDIARSQALATFQSDPKIQAMAPTKNQKYVKSDTPIAKGATVMQ